MTSAKFSGLSRYIWVQNSLEYGFYHGFLPNNVLKITGFSQVAEQTIESIQSFRANWSDGGDRYRNSTNANEFATGRMSPLTVPEIGSVVLVLHASAAEISCVARVLFAC